MFQAASVISSRNRTRLCNPGCALALLLFGAAPEFVAE